MKRPITFLTSVLIGLTLVAAISCGNEVPSGDDVAPTRIAPTWIAPTRIAPTPRPTCTMQHPMGPGVQLFLDPVKRVGQALKPVTFRRNQDVIGLSPCYVWT